MLAQAPARLWPSQPTQVIPMAAARGTAASIALLEPTDPLTPSLNKNWLRCVSSAPTIVRVQIRGRLRRSPVNDTPGC
jgi:hypothetical protein